MNAPGIVFSGSAALDGSVLFKDVSLELVPGGWTCLLGTSGVGKTTILRMIAGFDTRAELSGRIAASDGKALDDRIAYMAQEDLLLPWASVLDNVTLGARLRGERADRAQAEALIERVGLSAHVRKKPHALSGGQRQRVALARTLMEDRAVILLDEPFSALDAKTRSEMQDLSFELLEHRTVLLVTHDPGEAARLADRIVVMSAAGLDDVPPPSAPAPRAVDDGETLAAQGALMRQLREAS
ncbi:MAG: ABC transporter ATP-binding protein [Pseudomonadota bacterium]